MRATGWLLALLISAGVLTGCRPDAVWAPDGKAIAVEAKGQLYHFDVAARRFRQLTRGAMASFNPVWSPSGKRILYFRAGVQKEEVKSLQLAALEPGSGHETVLLPKLPVLVIPKDPDQLQLNLGNRLEVVRETLSASWSPDGRRLVYTAYAGEEPTLWTANADGSGSRRLLPPDRYGFHPVWSPDGKRIAYLGVPPKSQRPAPEPAAEAPPEAPSTLEVIAPDGTGQAVLWSGDRTPHTANIGPDPLWSADSGSLLVVLEMAGKPGSGPGPCELWTVPVDGGEPVKIVEVPGPSPFVTFGGSRLAFFYAPKSETENAPWLGLFTAPYREARRLGELRPELFGLKPGQQPEVEGFPVPSVSPDGKTIAIAMVQKKGPAVLLLHPTESGPARRYTIPVPAPTSVRKKPTPAPRRKR